MKPLFYKVFTKADYVQVISTYLGKWARDMGYQGELKVVPNAVDTEHFSQVYPSAELEALKIKLGKGENDKFVINYNKWFNIYGVKFYIYRRDIIKFAPF